MLCICYTIPGVLPLHYRTVHVFVTPYLVHCWPHGCTVQIFAALYPIWCCACIIVLCSSLLHCTRSSVATFIIVWHHLLHCTWCGVATRVTVLVWCCAGIIELCSFVTLYLVWCCHPCYCAGVVLCRHY